ncbi:hypothetical protein ACWDSJ_27750 [Nocardia sp. NPDC003482]
MRTAAPHIAVIDRLTETTMSGLQPVHDATDTDKVRALAEDMRENGWRGAPLVAEGEQCLTGSHRLEAVRSLSREGVDIPIPRIQVDDLCEAFGADWQALKDEYDLQQGWGVVEAGRHLDEVLPPEVMEYLGLDLH